MTIDCWIVCEERRPDARANGYERLVSVLKGTLGESAVTDLSTREQLKAYIRARTSSQRGGRLLIVGHRADLRKVQPEMFRELAETQGLDVLELQFTTVDSTPGESEFGEVYRRPVPYCSIRELSASLSRATLLDFTSQDKLNELIETYRAEALRSILDPLLPLAVLVDGFLVGCPRDAAEWFRPGIEAALEALSTTRNSVATELYWNELAESGSPVERIEEMLAKPADATHSFPAVLMTARNLGWAGGESNLCEARAEAGAVYRCACEAVKAAWDVLTSKDKVPPGGTEMRMLIEAASVGFHVLAAGHL